MKQILSLWLMLFLAPAMAAGPHALDFPVNLQKQSAAVVILFSLPDCAYCERVRQQSLRHIHTDPAYKGKVQVYEIDFSDNERKFIWFDGKAYTGRSIAGPLDVKFSPTVLVFSAKGVAAGKPLLGAGLPEFYGAYLDDLIQAAWGL